jgi:REP element-mobilizing transposase RayT
MVQPPTPEAGHLFQERFNSILVEKESYLLRLSRYIALNPVEAGMVARPEEYRWSSTAHAPATSALRIG